MQKLKERNNWLDFSVAIITCVAVIMTAVSCAGTKDGSFYYGSLGLGTPKILVATANPLAYTVLMYDINGNFIRVVWDSTADNDIPKGIAPYDAFSFAVLMDGVDRIARRLLTGGTASNITTNSNLTGTLYQMILDSHSDRYLAIETNTIEAFEKDGGRVGNPYIAATVGSCTLNVPRGLASRGDGRLFVVGTGNDLLLTYDVSGVTPTCVSSNNALNTFDPIAVLTHSNGLLYVATQTNDRIYSIAGTGTGAGTVVWDTNLTYINNPTAMLELPDGSILVASDGTNTIERITPSGTLVGSTSFIRDSFTGLVTQMMLIEGQ